VSAEARLANFIIGGTDKAGTTSVFSYLAQHPAVCAASAKETDFFRHQFTGDLQQDRATYGAYFRRCSSAARIVMEASPAYLAEAEVVAPRMAALLPDVRLLFILRNPVERLYSSYKFHLAKFNIPATMSIEQYVDNCLAYDRGAVSASGLGISEWCLKALRAGRYANSLSAFFAAFPRDSIHVMFFEQLERDARGFMGELSEFLGIDATFWSSYHFAKENVTYSVRAGNLHRLAMFLNSRSEALLRRQPKVKRALTKMYYRLTGARQGYAPMPSAVRSLLYDHYLPANAALSQLLQLDLPQSWTHAGPAH
jgi:hypothetical protein